MLVHHPRPQTLLGASLGTSLRALAARVAMLRQARIA